MEDKDYYYRDNGRNPTKEKCDSNLIDDGQNCMSDLVCKRIKCEKPTGCIVCDEGKVIKSYEQRLSCDLNEEKIGNLCFAKCKPGFTGSGNKCIKGVDNVLLQNINQETESKKMLDTSFLDSILESISNFIRNFNLIKFLKSFDKSVNSLFSNNLAPYRWYIIILIIFLLHYFIFNKILSQKLNTVNSVNSNGLSYSSSLSNLGGLSNKSALDAKLANLNIKKIYFKRIRI
jgi:hypothetical protein